MSKRINVVSCMYVVEIDHVTDLLTVSPVLELSSFEIATGDAKVSVITSDNRRVITDLKNLYNSKNEAQLVCNKYNTSLWKQD